MSDLQVQAILEVVEIRVLVVGEQPDNTLSDFLRQDSLLERAFR